MGKVKDLTPRKSAAIKALLNTEKLSNREVSRQLNVSESSVRRIKKKITFNEPLTSKRIGKCGRPRVFTPRSERCLKYICIEDRFATTKDIKFKLENHDIKVSERTVRRKLSDLQFRACRPARKPRLTPGMKAKRLAWAKSLKDKDLNFWKSVSTFEIFEYICNFLNKRMIGCDINMFSLSIYNF